MRPLPALLLACCLLLSGCGAAYVTPAPEATPTATPGATPTAAPSPDGETTPTATGTPTATATPAPQGYVAVAGGTLPVNATLVWTRTAAILGTDAAAPGTVEVRNVTLPATTRPSDFFLLWGLDRPNRTDGPTVAAYVRGPSRVYVNRAIRDRTALLEYTLAHEYVHVVQYRQGVFSATALEYGPSPDERATRTAVVEGSAVLVADAYWREHMTRGSSPAADIRALYRNTSGVGRWAVAPYRFGYRYASERAGPDALGEVYDDPPNSTEQLLHPGSRDPVADLNVTANDTDSWTHLPGDERMGELFVRVALATELSERRAADAAAGWGTDARVGFVNDTGANGYAWVLRFDDRANATEFEGALIDYLGARAASREDGTWTTDRDRAFRPVRVDDRTVVVASGNPYFVDQVTVGATNGTVRVEAPAGR